MLLPDLYWIKPLAPARLAMAPRPRAGEWLQEELAGWRAAGVDTVVSLLEAAELRELDLSAEEALSTDLGMRYVSFPIPDRGIPASRRQALELAQDLARQLLEGRGVVIHCRAGIGRSGLMAACVLVALGHRPGEVFAMLTAARGLEVPDTPEQARWVQDCSRPAPF
jgi:protein-tyrosine phosphatase